MAGTLDRAGAVRRRSPRTPPSEVGAALRSTPRHRQSYAGGCARWTGRPAVPRPRHRPHGGLRPSPRPGRPGAGLAATGRRLERRVTYSTDLLEGHADLRRVGCRNSSPATVDIRALLFPGARAGRGDSRLPRQPGHPPPQPGRRRRRCARLAAGHPVEEPLRVLEVGGGVGGTTSELVPALAEFGVGLPVHRPLDVLPRRGPGAVRRTIRGCATHGSTCDADPREPGTGGQLLRRRDVRRTTCTPPPTPPPRWPGCASCWRPAAGWCSWNTPATTTARCWCRWSSLRSPAGTFTDVRDSTPGSPSSPVAVARPAGRAAPIRSSTLPTPGDPLARRPASSSSWPG